MWHSYEYQNPLTFSDGDIFCCVQSEREHVHPAYRTYGVSSLLQASARARIHGDEASAADNAVWCWSCCGPATRTHSKHVPLGSGQMVRVRTQQLALTLTFYPHAGTERKPPEIQIDTFWVQEHTRSHKEGDGPPSAAPIFSMSELQQRSLSRHASSLLSAQISARQRQDLAPITIARPHKIFTKIAMVGLSLMFLQPVIGSTKLPYVWVLCP